jgi:predicted HicB family RNase H-like nuclease
MKSSEPGTKRVHIFFDLELHHQMRARAIRENKSLRRFIEDVIRLYLEKPLEIDK